MSFQAMAWAVDHKLPAMQKMVLLMMANQYNDEEGFSCISHSVLTNECGMSRRSVIRQIDELTKIGLIETVKTKNDSNMYAVNKYLLAIIPGGNNCTSTERKVTRKNKISPRLRLNVYERDSYQCIQCGTNKDLSLDHRHPESLGGKALLENLQTLCRSCNAKKGVSYEN